MEGVVKKGIAWLVVIFLVFYLFTHPVGMADLVSTVFNWIYEGFQQLFKFFTALGNNDAPPPPKPKPTQPTGEMQPAALLIQRALTR